MKVESCLKFSYEISQDRTRKDRADLNYSRGTALSRIFGGSNGANMNQLMIPLLNASGGYTYNAAGRPLSVFTDASGTNLPVYNIFALPGFNDPATMNANAKAAQSSALS